MEGVAEAMRWLTLVCRILLVRIRAVVYISFVLCVTVFFYWVGGGFEKRSAHYETRPEDEVLPVQPSKIDTKYPPLVRRYCNFPLYNASQDAMKDAGQTNLRLRGLMIITRHGDRAPLLPFPQHLNVPRCGLWDTDDADLFHQYRTDLTKAAASSGLPVDSAAGVFGSFLTAPPNERCRPGHLTAVGAVQLIRLGRRLREHYGTAWSFPSTTTECAARSTAYPRTYQSALAFLYGWTGSAYGEMKAAHEGVGEQKSTGQQCLLKAAETTYLCSDRWCMCPNRIDGYRRDHHQRLASFTRRETKDKDIKSIVQKIGAVLDTPKLEDPVSAFDTLMGYACHREALPCSQPKTTVSGKKKEQCVAKEWFQRLHNEIKNADMAAVKGEGTKNLFNVESAPILTRLAQLADELISTKKTIFEYYSGHDVSLRPLLSVLDVWDGSIPPYASHLAFELIEDTTKRDEDRPRLYYRVMYNGDDVTQKVTTTICKQSVLSRYNEAVFKLCNVNGLKDHAKRFVTFERNGEKTPGDEWVKLCK